MADIVLAAVDGNRSTGVNVTTQATAVSSGNTYLIPNNGYVRLVVANGASANTLTVQTPRSVDGNAVADLSIPLAASTTYVLGPFPTTIYNTDAGQLALSVSASASITAIRN